MSVMKKIGKFSLWVGLLLALSACGKSDTETIDANDPAWAEYDAAFLQACQASATDDKEAIMEGLCGCTLGKIKSNYSAKAVAQGDLTREDIQNLTGECAMVLKMPGVRFPEMARASLVSGCAAGAPALGDKAEAYCECSVGMLEKDYSYDQVMHGLVSQTDYQAIGAACVAEVGAGAPPVPDVAE